MLLGRERGGGWDETGGHFHFWQFPPGFWRCVRAANEATAAACVTLRGEEEWEEGASAIIKPETAPYPQQTREELKTFTGIQPERRHLKKKLISFFNRLGSDLNVSPLFGSRLLSAFFFQTLIQLSTMYPDANKGWVHFSFLNMLYFQIFFLPSFLPAMLMNTYTGNVWQVAREVCACAVCYS